MLKTQDIVMREKLLNIVKDSKLSLAKISKLSEVKESTLNNWVYMGIMPTLDNAEKVFKGLGYEIVIKKAEEEK